MTPWKLAEITYGRVKAGPEFQAAVLPLGATEPHNLHLPYGTDTFQVEAIASRACEIATARGARVLQLPAIPYGTETNQMAFPLAMNLNPSTLAKVIEDLVNSLARHRIHKFLLLNGHGGNDLKWILRELHEATPVRLFLCNWYKVAGDGYDAIFEKRDDHAGEMETSMGLAHFPGLVDAKAADEGSVRKSRFDAVNRGWVEITRPWHLLTTNSGAGDPRAASAEKGEAVTALVAERVGLFLADLAAAPLDADFPF
jgi:creatinine amidohydrolase